MENVYGCTKGIFEKPLKWANDPLIQIQQFIEDGAELVHIVDLDGARRGTSVQFELIRKLVEISRIPIQVGGGIRDLETIDKYICAGVARLVLGTAAIEKTRILAGSIKKISSSHCHWHRCKKWKSGYEWMGKYFRSQLSRICKKNGAAWRRNNYLHRYFKGWNMSGPNLYHLENIVNQVGCKIIASGGIRHYEDILSCQGLG